MAQKLPAAPPPERGVRRLIGRGVMVAIGLLAAAVPLSGAAVPGWPAVAPGAVSRPPVGLVSTLAPVCYAMVVDAVVSDPFRPPTQPWQAGNRGLEFATEPGQAVFAAAAGRVTFAGPVAHALYVTVEHDDGLRTSYSHLSDVAVTRDQRVQRGEPLGHAAARFHLGLRRGDTYLDPARLTEHVCTATHAILVPLDGGITSTTRR